MWPAMKCQQNSSTSGTAVGNAADLSVIDPSGRRLAVIVPAARSRTYFRRRGAYQQASDYCNINRGAVRSQPDGTIN